MTFDEILLSLGISSSRFIQGDLEVFSPIDGKPFAKVQMDATTDVDEKIHYAEEAFHKWKTVPAPRRGELVRLLGEELRDNKEALGALVTLDCGKSYQEGLGEVQEMIDICEFAVGISRQLHGLTIASERPGHHMRETWQPSGPVGIISAFNFPVAVWAWNASLALVCGDSIIWKPSEKTPVTAIACHILLERVIAQFEEAPAGLSSLIIGHADVGEQMVNDTRVPIISATGSTRMGREVGPAVAKRFGKSILELGGNNAMIVAPSADLEMATRGAVFSAVGTAGQRCTTLRRLIVHESLKDKLVQKIAAAYNGIAVGDPMDEKNLMGPLIDEESYDNMRASIRNAVEQGGEILAGARDRCKVDGTLLYGDESSYYVSPVLIDMPSQTEVVKTETFAPILYVMTYSGDLDKAIAMQNDVPQGLSSCIFTTDLREAEYFLSAAGSDCGIANVNIGPSGAEIGGAFGGEKETGGGRESGSDAWKGYMRRQTNTVNYSNELPLAQGIKFDI